MMLKAAARVFKNVIVKFSAKQKMWLCDAIIMMDQVPETRFRVIQSAAMEKWDLKHNYLRHAKH